LFDSSKFATVPLSIPENRPKTRPLSYPHDAVVRKIGHPSSYIKSATRFGEAVGDPIAPSAILGHANLKTVMRYCHPRESHTAKAMQTYIGSMEAVVDAQHAAASLN